MTSSIHRDQQQDGTFKEDEGGLAYGPAAPDPNFPVAASVAAAPTPTPTPPKAAKGNLINASVRASRLLRYLAALMYAHALLRASSPPFMPPLVVLLVLQVCIFVLVFVCVCKHVRA